MPQPLTVTLTPGQQIEALKRIRERYETELAQVESELTDILTAVAEADFLAQYLGDQPEVKELRARKADAEVKEQRRQYLHKLLERLAQVTPKQPEVKAAIPSAAKPGGIKRY
jgi:hypothetical protein